MFGVCYYPEHWPPERWPEDARAMAELGLGCVRIGEFAWSRLEPTPGGYDFDWLDRAIEVLNDAGLSVVLGSPTATPPKWLIDRHPEVLPVDPDTGRTRGFGSRRHYDFSSDIYLREALRITAELASRYGEHAGVIGWQTDNELCCHDTALSGSAAARAAFQGWCRSRYGSIERLNAAWGTVFWSMEYRAFEEVELPIGAVTETSPAHRLAYRRFSSARVLAFHEQMVKIIRTHAPGKFVTHNFIPIAETGVDSFELAAPLDFASYDNYPLGRTDLAYAKRPAAELAPYMRTGHPDLAAYCFDQTRGLGRGRFWIMEQQPGAVNWAHNNPRPAPGMIRFWTLEALAHGAECVTYFRWRQVPFGQEQMHAGLLRNDGSRTEAWQEIERVIAETERAGLTEAAAAQGEVAIVAPTEAYWLSDIERQSAFYDFDQVQQQYYRAARRLGLNVDFVPPTASFADYALVLAPCLPVVDDDFVARCEASGARFVFGPRSGAKTDEFALPDSLPPGALQALLPIRVLAVDTLRADCDEPLSWNGKRYRSRIWREQLDAGDCEVLAHFGDGQAAAVRQGRYVYLATLSDDEFLDDFVAASAADAGISTTVLDADLRLRRRGPLMFAFNYSTSAKTLPLGAESEFLLGGRVLEGHDVAVWRA